MSPRKCASCDGNRLNEGARNIFINEYGLAEFTNMQIKDLYKAITNLTLTSQEEMIIKQVKREIVNRLGFLSNVGLAEMNAKKSGFCGKSSLKYHPGAVAAWTEAGYKLPACAKP